MYQTFNQGQTCLGPGSAAYPQLILLDMNMPVLNGLGFLEAYAQLPVEQPPIVVVMLTTSLHPVDQARVQEFPIAGFLTKPLTKEKVTALLEAHFS
ncbi:MAG: response regulator [Hymenobacter sp.]|nr:MAG: response regulator [Hymenobacter sp.]